MQQKKHAEALEPNVKATGAQAGSKWHSPVGESTHRSPSGRTQKIVQNAKKERPILAHLCQNQNGPVGPCDWQRLTLQICECDACQYHDWHGSTIDTVTCTWRGEMYNMFHT